MRLADKAKLQILTWLMFVKNININASNDKKKKKKNIKIYLNIITSSRY